MKIYQTTVSYQDVGTSWLIIIRGKEKDVQETFNSFYNYMAVNTANQGLYGEEPLSFADGQHTVATFWSSEKRIRQYWKNIHEIQREGDPATTAQFVAAQMNEFLPCRETFHRFRSNVVSLPETYTTGSPVAEKPDADFKDSVLTNAFKNDKNESNEIEIQ